MEEKKSIKVSLSTVIILILILFIVFLLGYIYIIKNTKNEISSSNNNIDIQNSNAYTDTRINEISSNNQPTENIESNQKDEFVKFELIIDEGYNAGNNEIAHYHIVGKKEDGTRKEIIAVDEVNDGSLYVEILGVNQNKLYYTDNKGFAYIDLSSNNYERKSWIDFDEKKLDYSLLRYYLIKNDKLYFCKGNKTASFDSSIYSLNFDDKSLDNAELVINDAILYGENLNKYSNNSNIIYYTKLSYSYDKTYGDDARVVTNSLCSYDIHTKKSKTLFKDDSTCSYFMLGTSEILYGYNNDLHKYNLNTGKDVVLDNDIDNFITKGDTYYYVKENKIIKVSGSDKTTIYNNTYNGYTLGYISFFEDILVLSYGFDDPVDGGSMEKYMVNGTIKDKAPTISVNMKNGNIKQYGVNLVEKEIK